MTIDMTKKKQSTENKKTDDKKIKKKQLARETCRIKIK